MFSISLCVGMQHRVTYKYMMGKHLVLLSTALNLELSYLHEQLTIVNQSTEWCHSSIINAKCLLIPSSQMKDLLL